jgi:DNA replication protein DnaD
MEGWVKLYRKIVDNPLWTSEPFTKGQAWVDLLAMANHKDNKMFINGQWIEVKCGQLHTSELKLAARWKWSKNKVTRFLDVLKMDGMLLKNSTTGGTTNGTTLTLVNYGFYQGGETTNETTNEPTNGQRSKQRTDNARNINKNDKNVKNVEEDIYTPYIPLNENEVVSNRETVENNPSIPALNTEKEEKEKSSAKKEKEPKHKYGEFKNVELTDTEAQKLHNEYGDDAVGIVEHLSAYKAEKNYKTKSDYLTIKRWVVSAYYEHQKRMNIGNTGNSNRSIQERAERVAEFAFASNGR